MAKRLDTEDLTLTEAAWVEGWDGMAMDVHLTAQHKGWWDSERNDGEAIALIHSELSEGLEALREGNPNSVKADGFTGIEEELADVVVRIMDLAVARNWDVAGALVKKAQFNRNREHKHGGKKF